MYLYLLISGNWKETKKLKSLKILKSHHIFRLKKLGKSEKFEQFLPIFFFYIKQLFFYVEKTNPFYYVKNAGKI